MNIVHSILRTPKRRMTTALGVAKCQALLSVCISYQSLRDAIDKWPVNRFGPCFPCRLSLPFIPSIAETLEFYITTGYPFRHA